MIAPTATENEQLSCFTYFEQLDNSNNITSNYLQIEISRNTILHKRFAQANATDAINCV